MKNKTKRKVAALTLGSFFLMAMLSGCGSKDAEQDENSPSGGSCFVAIDCVRDFRAFGLGIVFLDCGQSAGVAGESGFAGGRYFFRDSSGLRGSGKNHKD